METKLEKNVSSLSALLLFALLTVYCIAGAAAVTVKSASLLRNPWENSYTEADQSYTAIHAVQTGYLYAPMSQPPYVPQAYGPLYYAADALLARFAHSDLDLFTFYARLNAYVAYLLCGLLVFLICRTATSSSLDSILAALMMLGQPLFEYWNVTLRPDMLYLFVMLASLYCAVRWGDRAWHGYALAGVLAGIASLIKQPGLAVAIAIFAVLLVEKQFKNAIVLTVGVLAPIVIVSCLLFWRRDPFFQQMAFAGKAGRSLWSLPTAVQLVAHQLIPGGWWIVPVCIGAIGFGQALRLGTRSRMIASFAVVSWIVGLSGLPLVGGDLNYFLPGLTGCALLLPYTIRVFREIPSRVSFAIIAGAAFWWALSTGSIYGNNQDGWLLPPTQASLTWLAPFRVLSDRPVMTIHGLEPDLIDPYAAHMLELTGDWDSTPILQNLDRSEYDLIIFARLDTLHTIQAFRGVSYFGPAEVDIIKKKYQVLCSTASSMVLVPRGRSVAATPQMFRQIFSEPCEAPLRQEPVDLKLAPGAR